MSIQLLSNLNYPIGNVINQELQNADNVQIAVAFIKHSGVKVVESALRQCLKNGGRVELITGLDFRTTEPKAIRYFIDLKKDYPKTKFFCFGDKEKNKTDIVFHPKIYLFEKGKEGTGIVGSTNLTRGGLTSNFEVNIIFKEKRHVNFSQLQAIYNSVKFTDSVFAPDEEYLERYSDIHGRFSKNEDNANKDEGLQKAIRDVRNKEGNLPGTVPTLISLAIDAIKKKQEGGKEFVPLAEIYEEARKTVGADTSLHSNYKMDTFDASLRGEINHNLDDNTTARSKHLFIRSKDKKGHYALTESGKNYKGR